MKRKGRISVPKHVVRYLDVRPLKLPPPTLPPRVRLGVALDWRYFAKKVPHRRNEIYNKRKDQEALRQLHARLVREGVIRA